ncbi:hypothetical protein [Burkholderia ubonensis]|nr:hypothetical protein [Burkholderia ubonensis]
MKRLLGRDHGIRRRARYSYLNAAKKRSTFLAPITTPIDSRFPTPITPPA